MRTDTRTRPAWPSYRHLTMTVAVLLVAVPAVVLFPGTRHLTDGMRSDVTTSDLLVFGVVAIAGAALKGISGFGYSLLVTPVAALIIDPTLAVVVLAVPPLMLNLFQVGETDTGRAYLRQNWALFVSGLIGSAIGVFLLSTRPNRDRKSVV